MVLKLEAKRKTLEFSINIEDGKSNNRLQPKSSEKIRKKIDWWFTLGTNYSTRDGLICSYREPCANHSWHNRLYSRVCFDN